MTSLSGLIVFAIFHISSCQNVVRMQQRADEMYHHNDVDGKIRVKQTDGRFAFASYYNDHMVLQQAPRKAVIWGFYPDVGYRVILKVEGFEKVYSADVNPGPTSDEGIWSVTLDPVPSGGPYTITVYSETTFISISDVLFGDVWVCSGQSNMQFTTSMIFNASEELADSSRYTNIRLFTVAMTYSSTPLTDLAGISEQWSLPNKTTLGHGDFTYFSAVCWLYGKLLFEQLGYPIGLIDTTWGGTPVEAWSSPDALAKCGLSNDKNTASLVMPLEMSPEGPSDLSQLWNAMVNPLLRMTIYGAIWYQGEADAQEPQMHRYNCTFPSMIDDWRAKFSTQSGQTDPDFPFGFVQLAPNRPISTDVRVGFPDVRWHQTADYGYVPNPRMKNVFMSVALDLPDFDSPYGSIHPRDKQDVAERLLLSGLRVAYNRGPTVFNGPLPAKISQNGGSVTLDYGSDWQIQTASDQGFELCCSNASIGSCKYEDPQWTEAPVILSSNSTVTLNSTICGSQKYIIGIRYAWRESLFEFKKGAVYSFANALPAPPFINFKPKSAGSTFTYTIDWSNPTIIP